MHPCLACWCVFCFAESYDPVKVVEDVMSRDLKHEVDDVVKDFLAPPPKEAVTSAL